MEFTRRGVLRAATAGVGAMAIGAGWTPVGRIEAAQAAVLPVPSDLPRGVAAYLLTYRNWAGNIVTAPLWHVTVTGEQQVVDLANWAYRNGWKLRPKGFSHNWSPLAVPTGDAIRTLLVDTRVGLAGLSGGSGIVTAGAGASLDALLAFMDLRNVGLAHHPAPGDLTVGGMLAIGAHGAVTPAIGETRSAGHSFGSLSNLVVSLRAVVWDSASSSYLAKTFTRSQYETGALLVHLGRAFITQVTLRVGPRQSLRCQSRTDVHIAELCAPQGSSGRTFASYLDKSGRAEIIWFPFTEKPWLKVWTVAPYWPLGSRPTLVPYNYAFADIIPEEISDLVDKIATQPALAPLFGSTQLSISVAGLTGLLARDLWGTSSNVLRYVRPTTLRVMANGYALLCARADVQLIVNAVYEKYRSMLQSYQARGLYPINGPMEVRATGLDDPADVGVAGAVEPWLSPTRRRPDRPAWDTAVWFDLLTLTGTKGTGPFYREFEDWLYGAFDPTRVGVRVEWSKGWGYSDEGAWTNASRLAGSVRDAIDEGQAAGTRFADAVRVLNSLDPGGIYSSPLLAQLMA